jgi:hypothetical protein
VSLPEITAAPVYELVSGDGTRLVAEAEGLTAILNAAQTLRDDGENVADLVVMCGGKYDGATTALIQEGLV